MKLKHYLSPLCFTLLLFFSGQLFAQQTVIFQLDATDADFKKITDVGIRGSIAPLSWTQSIPMSDPDKDGIFTSEVILIEGEVGDRLQYKYMINDIWENDRYAEAGNRVLTLAPCTMINPIDKWDQLEEFPMEALIHSLINYDTWFWVYTISVGKKDGKSTEEVISGFFNFWGNTFEWATSPEILLYDQQYNMANFPNGEIEVIEKSDKKVVFRAKKARVDMMNMYKMEKEFYGITREDLDLINNVYLQMATKAKNWKLTIEDDGDYEVITIEK